MKKIFLFQVFKSKYCLFAFVAGLFLGYLLVPKTIFKGYLFILGLVYIFVFALVLTCITRVVKERVLTLKQGGAGIISLLASVLGIGAMQMCGIGAPVCGATVGISILSFIFPNVAVTFFDKYSVVIIIFSVIFQVLALYYMGCFKKCLSLKNTN